MYGLVALSLALATASDFGPAPQDTLDPAERLNHFSQIFRDCEFSAVQTKHPDNPNGHRFTEQTRVLCKACRDATLVRVWVRMKDQVNSKGVRLEERGSFNERRWVRSELRYHLELLARRQVSWPTAVPNPDGVTIDKVVTQSPSKPNDQDLVWDQIVLSNFVGDIDWTTIRFSDMFIDGGRLGYRREGVTWALPDHSSGVTYRFNSADYGAAAATFTRVGSEWMPTRIHVVKSANHKVVPDELQARKNRLKEFREYDGFTKPVRGLDRFESLYEISYPASPGRAPLPVSIRRTDTQFSKKERVIVTTALRFESLRAGDVSCDEVRKTMLPIPDGRRAFVLDSDQKNIAWTTKDGKVIKKIDADAIAMGRTAAFSSRPRLFTLLAVNGLLVSVAVVLFRRGRLVKGVS